MNAPGVQSKLAGLPDPIKLGMIGVDAEEVQNFGDDGVTEMVERAAPLVPVYDAMMREFGA